MLKKCVVLQKVFSCVPSELIKPSQVISEQVVFPNLNRMFLLDESDCFPYTISF